MALVKKFTISRTSPISQSIRVRQLEALFDVPRQAEETLTWQGDLSGLDAPWNVGLIVGPSGSGKSTLLRERFGSPRCLDWDADSVIDAFDSSFAMQEIASVCQAVGFNTIPAWRRRFAVLSNGEQFRVTLARLMLEAGTDVVPIDEFTSVVDRQVAKIGSHAVQKYARRHDKRIVCASVHDDIIDWLQPDWIIQMPTMHLERRSLRGRPSVDVCIERCDYDVWSLFAPFHYLTHDLHRAAKCFCLSVNGRKAAFAATLHRPHAHVKNLEGLSRIVTLPDWQGLGLAFVLSDALGSAFKAIGKDLHTYPAHPSLIRNYDKSPNYALRKNPGKYSSRQGDTKTIGGSFGGRPCAVFKYIGPPMESKDDALAFIYAGKSHG